MAPCINSILGADSILKLVTNARGATIVDSSIEMIALRLTLTAFHKVPVVDLPASAEARHWVEQVGHQ